jgi:hypothetical protein
MVTEKSNAQPLLYQLSYKVKSVKLNKWYSEFCQVYTKHVYTIVLFVETPHKFITAVINLHGVSTNKTIICFIAMQTYKERMSIQVLYYRCLFVCHVYTKLVDSHSRSLLFLNQSLFVT